jgi:putative hydrolase of the HAD superfamily
MTYKIYRDLFFDLDHTLWDFETNSLETLNEIYEKHSLKSTGIPTVNDFIEVYHRHNYRLWADYRRGKIVKAALRVQRFELCLKEFGIHNQPLSVAIANDYVRISPTKTNLFPHTLEVLEYLAAKYRMHIITNGFEEVQFTKLKLSGLMAYFTEVITSEDAGSTKPNPAIFDYALKRSGAKAETSIMIGDDADTDIKGARLAGMDQVLFDVADNQQDSLATYRITSLDQLTSIL